jgi:succinyl-CoA synthetase alpha subunit
MASFFLNQETRAIIQGITGKVGQAQARWMLAAGTKLVGGVTPGKGGQVVEGLPVYDTVSEAVCDLKANASVVFVPAQAAREAAISALEAGIKFLVIVTEHIPVRDTMEIKNRAQLVGANVLGPNCPGIFVPELGKLGIMPQSIFRKGCIGVVGRSGTLTYEVIANLTESGLGETAAIGIGGDPVVCIEFIQILDQFERDEKTKGVALIGEIGGGAEERAVEQIVKMKKPIVALIAGRSAPPGKRFGHAGAIVEAGVGSAEQKMDLLLKAGVTIAESPAQIPSLLKRRLYENSFINVEIKLRGFLESFVNRQSVILSVKMGCTLSDVINKILEQMGGESRGALLDEHGNLHGGIEVFLNREHISPYELTNIKIWEDSEVIIVPIIAGGE